MDKVNKISCLLLAVGLFQACGPAPRRALTSDEKVADLYWIYSQFGNNYAPLEYKEKTHQFTYEDLKKKYVAEAQATQTNDEFYALMYRFVAEFKDAHTSASIMNSDLPGRAKVAYLGFSGVRKGDTLVVKELLPTMVSDSSNYPIQKGTVITKLDGVPLKEIVTKELSVQRNLGQDETNLTYHMNKIFNRISTFHKMPTKDMAVVTIKDGDKEVEVTVPWITKDLRTFKLEQEQAEAAKKDDDKNKDEKAAGSEKKTTSVASRLAETYDALGASGETLFSLRFVGFDGLTAMPYKDALNFRPEQKVSRFLKNFRFLDNVSLWTTATKRADSMQDLLKEERTVPSDAIMLSAAKTFPTYLTRKKVPGATEGQAKDKLIAVMWLNTFSPQAEEKDVLDEVKETLKQIETLGVEELVIDMASNGGGSLLFGMHLAQLLADKQLEMPQMQVAVNETWLDDFESASLDSGTDYEKEFARRVFVALDADLKAGRRLSAPLSLEALAPYTTKVEAKAKRPKMALVVNEMCASMCDIFTGIMKDNGAAVVVGGKTMGAGGNVVSHYSAPNSHLVLNQTESLMLRKDGTYVENNGIEPDVKVDMTDLSDKYAKAIDKAAESLLKKEQLASQ